MTNSLSLTFQECITYDLLSAFIVFGQEAIQLVGEGLTVFTAK
jgi:hypothetical protein